MLNYDLRTRMKDAFTKASDKKELYRLLKVAESLGLTWGVRQIYGGGTSVTLEDNVDVAVEAVITKDGMYVSFNEEYFEKDFIPHKVEYFSGETLAEIMNEEALYQYELPHYRIVKDYDAVA